MFCEVRCLACACLFHFYNLCILPGCGTHIIPYPKKVVVSNEEFVLDSIVKIVLSKSASSELQFAAGVLIDHLSSTYGVKISITNTASPRSIVLSERNKIS